MVEYGMETFTLKVERPMELLDLIGEIRELQSSQGLPDDMLTFIESAEIKWSLRELDDEYDYSSNDAV